MVNRALTVLVAAVWIGCAPASYLETHEPWDLIFQKKVYGGAADLVGTELNAPVFSLYANGSVIYYRYVDGKRKLACSRLDQNGFLELLKRISDRLTPIDSAITLSESADVPVTEFLFYGRRIKIKGLGFSTEPDSLESFNRFIDQFPFPKSREYSSEKILLYVKRLPSGDTKNWPEWKLAELDLEKIYKKNVSFYEPNSDENSLLIEGRLAGKIQNLFKQTGIYQKFSFRDKIYAVGYRPLLPR